MRISPRKINILKQIKIDLIELIELYNINRKQLLRNLTNILKSTTKHVEKGKKNAQNFFILKYVIKGFKTSKLHYLRVLL